MSWIITYPPEYYLQLGGAGDAPSTYDTIVGVGASITGGVFAGPYFESPFRGVSFVTDSTGGATLQNIIDNIQKFIDLANGKTLFLIHAGGNDCSALTSALGTGDSALGTVINYDSIGQANKSASEARYRELISLLKPHGDLAVASLTFRDYKGQVLQLQNPSSVGSGSWNDSLLNGLIQELNPEWFGASRPIMDYYTEILNNADVLDADNVHMYNDNTYVAPSAGYPDGIGSKTLRNYMIKILGEQGAIPDKPFSSEFKNRIRINVGSTTAVTNRPFYNGEDNNIAIDSNTLPPTNLVSYDDSQLSATPVLTLNYAGSGLTARVNLGTTFLSYSEGLLDTNAMSSSLSTSLIWGFTITNIEKGVISMAGLRQTTSRDDAAYSTKFSIIDDNGRQELTVGSSWDSSSPEPFDQIASFEFDATNSGQIQIEVDGVGSNNFGYLSSINIDILK